MEDKTRWNVEIRLNKSTNYPDHPYYQGVDLSTTVAVDGVSCDDQAVARHIYDDLVKTLDKHTTEEDEP